MNISTSKQHNIQRRTSKVVPLFLSLNMCSKKFWTEGGSLLTGGGALWWSPWPWPPELVATVLYPWLSSAWVSFTLSTFELVRSTDSIRSRSSPILSISMPSCNGFIFPMNYYTNSKTKLLLKPLHRRTSPKRKHVIPSQVHQQLSSLWLVTPYSIPHLISTNNFESQTHPSRLWHIHSAGGAGTKDRRVRNLGSSAYLGFVPPNVGTNEDSSATALHSSFQNSCLIIHRCLPSKLHKIVVEQRKTLLQVFLLCPWLCIHCDSV